MFWTRKTKIALAAAALAAGAVPTVAVGSSWHGGWGGWGQGRHARHADWCAPAGEARLAEAMALIEMHLALRPDQQHAWARLSEAVAQAGQAVKIACSAPASDTPSALARLEAGMQAGLGALRALRPSLEALYTELDPDQRTRLDGLMRGRL
ncbi:MAG: hypothetical protein FJX60_07165 [Alphaproteobacteria bacterium]|nr:hypothetical protein [Alphaproteobacteria bacterium]